MNAPIKESPSFLEPRHPGRVRSGAPGKMILVQVLAAMLVLASTGYAQKDDFNDNVADGWNQYNPIGVGSWSLSGGTYSIRTAASPNPTALGPGRAGSLRNQVSYSDFYVSVDLVAWNSTLDQAIGLMARLDDIGLGTTDGYAFTYSVQDADINITRFMNENPDEAAGGAEVAVGSVNIVPGRSYRLVFIGVGTRLTGRVYELPEVRTPIAEITGLDTVYTSGICGLLNFSNAATGTTDATYDNYLALNAEPPVLTIVHTIFDDLWVFWPTTATGFVLQSTPSLRTPIVWTDICPPYERTLDGTQFQHTADLLNPEILYYRLEQKVCPP